MAFSDIPLDRISSDDLDALVALEVVESARLDFKLQLPANSDSDKREFLADVASFANASGGDIIYGVREEKGKAVEVPGLTGDPDQEILRLTAIARTGIDPRIPQLEARAVSLDAGRFVIIVRTRRSWLLPHMVVFQGVNRFVTRGPAGKYPLDVTELRTLFLQSAEAERQIRDFRAGRLSAIISGETPVALAGEHYIVLHLIPLSSFATLQKVDLSSFESRATELRPIGSTGYSWRHDLDGFVCYDSGGLSGPTSYAEIFRNGAIEAVVTSWLEPDNQGTYIPGTLFEQGLLEVIPSYLKLQQSLGISLPIVAMLSLLNVRGYYMAGPGRLWRTERFLIQRQDVVTPGVLIDSYDVSYVTIGKQLVDPIWNASGWAQSPNFTADGQWTPRR